MKIKDEFSGTLTLTENSTKELFRVLKEQDETFINDVLDGEYGFTLKSADGRSVTLIPADKLQGEWELALPKEAGEFFEAVKNGCSWRCSICGAVRKGNKQDMNFCPNCKARMRPKLQGKHFDSITIDECAMKGADDE